MPKKYKQIAWDDVFVHGNHPDVSYIRYKENTDALAMIAPDLKKAYAIRKEMWLQPYKTVQLQVISWLRSLLNQKTINKK